MVLAGGGKVLLAGTGQGEILAYSWPPAGLGSGMHLFTYIGYVTIGSHTCDESMLRKCRARGALAESMPHVGLS